MLPSEVKEKEAGKKKDVPSFPWTREQEALLAEWAEKSMCYRWLHARSEKSYRFKNYSFTIPVIILKSLKPVPQLIPFFNCQLLYRSLNFFNRTH